ncbi:MAG: glycine cleavage system protein H [Thermoplasmata archaeon]
MNSKEKEIFSDSLNYRIDRRCLYHKEHTWIRITDSKTAFIGLSDFAQKEMGVINMADLPEPGDEVCAGRPFGTLESGKWVQKLFAPVSGTVKASNREAMLSGSIINKDPYGKGWLLQIELEDISRFNEEKKTLMTHEEYSAFCLKEKERIKAGNQR